MGMKPGRVRDMVVMAAKPKQRTVGGGVRSTLYEAVKGELPDPNVLRVAEVYADFPAELAPLITTLAISPDIPLVDSALGKVQEGSLIAMQHPVVVSRCIQYHPDAPPPPPLPLADYRLEPTTCQFVCSLQEQLHLVSLQTSWEAARQVEASTRDQSLSAESKSKSKGKRSGSLISSGSWALPPCEKMGLWISINTSSPEQQRNPPVLPAASESPKA
ncbi:uncharacterized protein LOC125299368 [Alosa alosa]|uniref:uncharacterized protein LOC125299368 n=1 Tax=Alosa alosa TaxID=278164 RepID=UPI002015381B|nr:uncharacterized protein LOC125299368 [Alosa alosa]